MYCNKQQYEVAIKRFATHFEPIKNDCGVKKMTQKEIKQYSSIVEFLGITLGPDYEVVLHDLSTPESSIVAIANGHISSRTVGYPLKKGFLEAMSDNTNSSHSAYHFSYTMAPKGGKMLRSSTLYIKDKNDIPVGLLCINFDDSRYQELSTQIFQLCHPDAFVKRNIYPNEETTFFEAQTPAQQPEDNSIPELMKDLIEDVVRQSNLDVHTMTQHQKQEITKQLQDKGVFQVKGAVDLVAKILQSSPATIYRYLNKLK